MEMKSVLTKIRSLLSKTTENGCTEQEAMSAAEKVGELMQVYNLSLDQVFLDNQKCVQLRISTGRKRKHAINFCVLNIAAFCDCKVWVTKTYVNSQRNSDYIVFGLPTDTEMVKHLYDIILNAIDSETAKFKLTGTYLLQRGSGVHGKRLSSSFQKGMVHRIGERLDEIKFMRQNVEREHKIKIIDPETMLSKETSIVLVKKSKVEKEFEELDIRLTSKSSSYCTKNYSAYGAGQTAGDRVNLNRPVGGKVTVLLEK